MSQQKPLKRDKQIAQTMVEFALVFPLLVFLLYGILEFGRLMFIYISVINSSREAARYGSSVGNPGSYRYVDCAGMLNAARRSAILTVIQPSDVSITYDRDLGNTILFGGAQCGSPAVDASKIRLGDRVNVQVTLIYTPIMPVNWDGFPVTAHAARTIIKSVEVAGENVGELGTPRPYFNNPGPFDENEADARSWEITVLLDNSPTQDVTLPLLLSGTATNGQDYTLSSVWVTFPAGDTVESVTLTILNDDLDEDDIQQIIITLGTPTNPSAALPCSYNCTLTVNIFDDDLPPDIYFAVPSSETLENISAVNIMVSLSTISERSVTFSYGLALDPGTATRDVDYRLPPMPTTIPPLTLSVATALVIVDDTVYEDNETVILQLTAATNATILSPGGDLHTATIINNDPPPVVSFDLAEATGSEDIGIVRLALRLNRLSAKPVEIRLAVVNNQSTATRDVDYVLVNGINYTIPAGERETEVNISITPDQIAEEPEVLVLSIASVTDGTIGVPSQHKLTIIDVALPPVVQFTSTGYSLDEELDTGVARIYLNNAWKEDITVSFSRTGTASDGLDYAGVTPSPVVIRAGAVSVDILIPVWEDVIDEADETVILTITGASAATSTVTVGTPAGFALTILDDDIAPTVSFVGSGASVEEGAGVQTVTVALSTVSGIQIEVPFSSSGTARPNLDYQILTPSPLVFPPGVASQTIQVNFLDDDVFLGARSLILTLGAPLNATLVEPIQFTFNILENEMCPTLTGWTLDGNLAYTTVALPVEAPIIILQSMTITQQSGQALREAELGPNNVIFQGNLSGTPVTITNFKQGSALTLSGATGGRVLLLTFKDPITLTGSYSVSLTWSNGCTVSKP